MSSRDLPVVILCGGLGTRLRTVVNDRPKVLAEIQGRPFLAYLVDYLAAEGVRQIILSAGHMAELVESFVVNANPTGLELRVVTEPQPLGTAGALRYASAAAGLNTDFFALNGDTFFSASLDELAVRHARARAVATVALAHVPDVARYGSVQFDAADGAVQAFEEKGRSGAGWINAGVYVLSPGALASVPLGALASLERDVLPSLIGRGLVAVPFHNATFLDIGTPEDYSRAASVLTSEASR